MALTEVERVAIHKQNVELLQSLRRDRKLIEPNGVSLTLNEQGLLTEATAYVGAGRYHVTIHPVQAPPSPDLGRAWASELVCTKGQQELFSFSAIYRQAYPHNSSLTRVLTAPDGRTLSYTFHEPAARHAKTGYIDAMFSAPGSAPTTTSGTYDLTDGNISIDLDVLSHFDVSQLEWMLPFAGAFRSYLARFGIQLPHVAGEPSMPVFLPLDLSLPSLAQNWPYWVTVLAGVAGCTYLGIKLSGGNVFVGAAAGVVCAVVLVSALNDMAGSGADQVGGSGGNSPSPGPASGSDGGAPLPDPKEKDRTNS